tara:strand:- start:45 stop:704 length:660 start_codon:yes stop_codon:yes gene_type:complete
MKLSHIHEDIQRKLRVGYDMDDVLADLDQVLRQEVSKKTGKYIAKPDRTEYYFEDIPALLDKLGMSKEELGPLVVKSFGNVFGHRKSDITAISGSINTIKELQKDGHSVIIITARDKKRSFDITNEWLKYMGIGDVKVYFAGTGPDRTAPKNSKAKVARLLKLDYFVDDSVENLGQFKKTGQDKLTKPIIFDQPWNSSYDGPRLTDHHSMMDLLNKLEN